MKKIDAKSLVIGVIIGAMGLTTAFAAEGIKSEGIKSAVISNTTATLDGVPVPLNNPLILVTKDNETDARLYMPFREIFEHIGYSVEWDGETNSVNLSAKDNGASQDEMPDVRSISDFSELMKTEITAYGDIVVEKDVDMAGDFFSLATHQTLTIEEGVTVNVYSHNFCVDGKIVNKGRINVYGRICFYRESAAIGDIHTVDGGRIVYMCGVLGVDRIKYFLNKNSIYTGLSFVPAMRSDVVIDKDLTIPKGKTLWLNSYCTLIVPENVTLTVNGIIETYNAPVIKGIAIGDNIIFRE